MYICYVYVLHILWRSYGLCVHNTIYTAFNEKTWALSLSDNLNIIMRYVRRRYRKPQYIGNDGKVRARAMMFYARKLNTIQTYNTIIVVGN